MKNKLRKAVVTCLAILVLLISVMPVSAAESTRTVGEAQSFIDGIVACNLKNAGTSSIQSWINGSLTKNAGSSSEWYAIALSQYGSYSMSSYESALITYLEQNEVYSASTRQKYALALIASGSTNSYIYTTLNNSIGQQGVMSWVFGLHLLNNGYTSNSYSLTAVKQKLVSLQLSDGGWAVTGSNSDIDVTAMALQALAPYYNSDSSVKTAVDSALILLSNRQKRTGDYASYGVCNPESTAQVLVALSSLGIDCKADSRFIKNGNTLFDGIGLYQLSNGSFCHKEGGSTNSTATVQVFYSMVSYLRMKNGQSGLYILDARNPSGLQVPENSSTSESSGNTASGNTTSGNQQFAEQNTSNSTSNGKVSDANTADKSSASTNDSDADGLSSKTKEENSNGEVNATEDKKVSGEKDTEADEGGDAEASISKSKMNNSYKWWVSFGIVIVAGISCIVLYLRKKRNLKNYLAVLAITVVGILLVCMTRFQTTEEYYQNAEREKTNIVGTVTITIRCDTIVEKSNTEGIPSNGVILETTEVEIEDGDTVYDVLLEVTGTNKIHLETSGSEKPIYVEGIYNIYEFDYGDLSGWMYFVNGKEPSIGCGEYELSAGDEIEWLYTCEIGKDLE